MIIQKTSNRFFDIDLLRATAILGVMITHSLVLFLGPAWINSAWNYLHFVVVAFVFCSGYVTYDTYQHHQNGENLFGWYKKRFVRLYLPYLVYLLVYSILIVLFPGFIAGRGISLNPYFVLKSVALLGGADVGWLTLLFLQLAVLTPVLMKINHNKRLFIIALTVLGLFAGITAYLRIPTIYSRAVAWFPWLFIFLIGSGIAQKDQRKGISARYMFLMGLISICAWFLFTKILINLGEPLTLTLHKYPPDMFYFLYGIGVNSLLFGFVRLWKHPWYSIRTPVAWLSRHSYGMFFTHLVLVDIVIKTIPGIQVIAATMLSVGATLFLTWGWTMLLRRLRSV